MGTSTPLPPLTMVSIQSITDTLRHYSESPFPLVRKTVDDLADTAFLRPANQTYIATTTDAVKYLLECMGYYRKSRDMQLSLCNALEILAYDNPKIQNDIQNRNGIESLLNTMKLHRLDIPLQRSLCSTLSAVIRHNKLNQTVRIIVTIISNLLETMKLHTKDIVVQQNVCDALISIVTDVHQNSITVGKCEGIQCIINAMQMYSNE